MKLEIAVAQDRAGQYWLKKAGARTLAVCTVTQACRELALSRRQVYRHIAAGVLEPAGKLLGDWLLDRRAVARLARYPLWVQPLPESLKPLFTTADWETLNAGRDRLLVVARVLELGGWKELAWLIGRYRQSDILEVLALRDAVSAPAHRLWSLFFTTKAPRASKAAGVAPDLARARGLALRAAAEADAEARRLLEIEAVAILRAGLRRRRQGRPR